MELYKYDYGFIYEYGYNLGLYRGLYQQQKQGAINFDRSFQDRVETWMKKPEQAFPNLVSDFIRKHRLTDEGVIRRVRRELDQVFFVACIEGNQNINLYLETLPEPIPGERSLVYFQANLINPLNLDIKEDEVTQAIQHDIINAFQYDMKKNEQEHYKKKGRFLRADSIVLIKQLNTDFKEEYHLLVTDNALKIRNFSGVKAPRQLLETLENHKRMLGKKPIFSRISIDTSGTMDFPTHKTILQNAQKNSQDKTLLKSIQAGSYAYSFLDFLEHNNKITDEKIHISLMAQTEYDYSIINLPFQTLQNWKETNFGRLLKDLYDKYSSSQLIIKEEEKGVISKEVNDNLVYNILQNALHIDFEELYRLLEEGKGIFEIKDRLEGFQSTAGKYGNGKTFRDDHAQEVSIALLEQDCLIVFLTGNPGIGKTTIIAEKLKQKGGFLFLYTSCRKAVNDDIDDKFIDKETLRYFSDNFITLSASSTDESIFKGKKVSVVNYSMNDAKQLNQNGEITYLDKNREIKYEDGTNTFRTIYDDLIVENDNKHTPGVLKRLVKGIHEQIENPNINQILGTFSIQALKKTGQGRQTASLEERIKKSTIKHFLKLFPFVTYTEQLGTVIDEAAFSKFVKKHPTTWIMIDEVTGSDEGAALYQFFRDWLFPEVYLKLSPENQKKWDLKLIVADASITNRHIIDNYLNDHSDFEHPKIYITDAEEDSSALENEVIEVSVGKTKFKKGKNIKGRIINSNSFPAAAINLNYHIMIEGMDKHSYNIGKNAKLKKEKNIGQKQDDVIVDKIVKHLVQNPEEQLIVYIQDINRLFRLAEKAQQRYQGEDGLKCMVISSQLSQKSRAKALAYKDAVQCVFMTSSASRGISFAKTTKILAVLQPWGIERELMEQIQLYYRMRGNSDWDANKDKSIEFFILDTYIYDTKEDERFKKDKTLAHILSFITIVRSCLESRAFGKTKIGGYYLSLVPLGGKGVSPVKQSLFKDVADSMKLLTKELASKEQFKKLAELQEMLGKTFRTKLETYNQVYRGEYDFGNVYSDFKKRVRQNLFLLLDYEPFQNHYITNGLIVFGIPNKVTERVLLEKNSIITENLIKRLGWALQLDLTADLKKKLTRIKTLLEFEKHQPGYVPAKFIEGSSDQKRYLAIPLLAFTMAEELKREQEPSEGEPTFLDVLPYLVRFQADASSITPIEGVYADVPFITFISDSFEEVTKSMFQKNHLLVSTETNILNLLLMQ